MKAVTSEEKAFRAGWVALSRYEHHEWGPEPPSTPELAYMKWKGIPLPHPTDKQEQLMRDLFIWSRDCTYMTVKEAATKISAAIEGRKADHRYYDNREDEYGDPDDYDLAIADVMNWGFDD